MTKKRFDLYLTQQQIDVLQKASEQTLAPIAAMIRLAVDEFIRSRNLDKKVRLAS